MDLNVTVPEITIKVTILPQLEKVVEAIDILDEMVTDSPWLDDAKEARDLLIGAVEDGEIVHEN